jgi:beta-1,4-mannosyltransferase
MSIQKMRILAWPGFEVGEKNPYTSLLCQHIPSNQVHIDDCTLWRTLLGQYDILHVHWPEVYVADRNPFIAVIGSLGLLFIVCWCRMRGAKVIWTVHNLEAHHRTRPRMEKRLMRLFTRVLSGYIALTDHGRREVRRRFPSLESIPGFVIPHGHYRGAYPSSIGRAEARRRLEIPEAAKMVLFFGTIQSYKNVPALVRAFRELKVPNIVLHVVGSCRSRREQDLLKREAGQDSRIRLDFGFVPRAEVSCFFEASDLVVLPFAEILNSGTALLALSFNRPILVPEKGAMSELQFCAGTDWVQTYDGSLTRDKLARALDWASKPIRPKVAPLDSLDWDYLGQKTAEAYRAILRGGNALVQQDPRKPPVDALGEPQH